MEETNGEMEKNGTGGDGKGRIYGGEEDREIKMERANICLGQRNDRERGRVGDRERWSGQESKPLTCRLGAAAVCVCVCVWLV